MVQIGERAQLTQLLGDRARDIRGGDAPGQTIDESLEKTRGKRRRKVQGGKRCEVANLRRDGAANERVHQLAGQEDA